MRALDLAGQMFGYLEVIDRLPAAPRSRWLCVCACGSLHEADGSELRRGRVSSCGCMTNKLIGRSNTKHGKSRSRAYRAWAAMLSRCKDVRNNRYGGRGIQVVEAWRYFDVFYADMGDPPSGCSIERVDNNRGYSKDNCVWATPEEQTRNRSNTILLTHNGVTDTLAAHARRAGLRYDTVHKRLFTSGWPVDKALTVQPGVRVEVSI